MKFISLIIFILMIIINALGGLGKFNATSISDISKTYNNLITPASFTFWIWFVIYILLLVYILYSVDIIENDNSNYENSIFNKVKNFFIANMFFNILWVISWVYNDILLSMIFIIAIFFTLLKITEYINSRRLNNKQVLYITIPFNLYFGWISVALVSNLMTLITSYGIRAFSASGYIISILLLILGILIFYLIFKKNNNAFYFIGFLWGYIGIFANHIIKSGFSLQYPFMLVLSIISIFIVIFIFLLEKKIIKLNI